MSGGKVAARISDNSLPARQGFPAQPSGDRARTAQGAANPPTAGLVRRYLSCLRYREILLLQGSPLLGAAFAIGVPSVGKLAALGVLMIASCLLVAYVFALN